MRKNGSSYTTTSTNNAGGSETRPKNAYVYFIIKVLVNSNSSGNNASNSNTTVYNVGDYAQGGVVFWVDPSDSTKGLVCAISDQTTAERWNVDANSNIPNAIGLGIGTGSSNSDEIISTYGLGGNNYAAKITYNYGGGGYDDWFLPSRDELLEIYSNKGTINSSCTSNGGTSLSESDWYWSSSIGTDQSTVWEVDMSNGNSAQGFWGGNNVVRAIRSYQ